jgi:hypothetical protein
LIKNSFTSAVGAKSGVYLMPRTNLDAGLKELRAQLMHVGLQVEDSLAKSLKVIETGN